MNARGIGSSKHPTRQGGLVMSFVQQDKTAKGKARATATPKVYRYCPVTKSTHIHACLYVCTYGCAYKKIVSVNLFVIVFWNPGCIQTFTVTTSPLSDTQTLRKRNVHSTQRNVVEKKRKKDHKTNKPATEASRPENTTSLRHVMQVKPMF